MVYLESGYSDSGYHIENLVNRTKIILNIKSGYHIGNLVNRIKIILNIKIILSG